MGSRFRLTWLVAAWPLLGALSCGGDDDPAPCEHEGTVRCAASGRAVERCGGPGDLRWRPAPCGAETPRCQADARGVPRCVSSGLGTCAEGFEGRCAGEREVEFCDGSAIRRTDCGEDERCVRLPEDRVPTSGTGAFACVPVETPERPPAVVTFVDGDVEVGGRDAPAVPFQILPGTPLRLGDGARVVVLVKSRASRLTGPGDVDVYELQPEAGIPDQEAVTVVARLSHPPPARVPDDEPLRRPAPSGDGVIRWMLGEGVPGAASSLGDIQWRCAEPPCGQTVELRDEDRVVFRGQGEGIVHYDGPALELGHQYTLALGERTYPLVTESPVRLDHLLASMSGWSLEEQMSVVAAVHVFGGSRAAALEAFRQARSGNRDRFPELDVLRAAYGDAAN